MLIINQHKDMLINLDNVVSLVREEMPELDKIQYWADTTTNDTILLGKYEDTPEHENLIEKIAQAEGAVNVFYMPEED